MSLPVLPSAQTLTPADLANYGAQVVEWAEQVDDIAAVRDLSNKWAAITEYVRRTSQEGIAEAEQALRRLELRVGALLGPAPGPGRPTEEMSSTKDISRNQVHEFRLMAAHPEIVEQVIATSSDESPPSRRKVVEAIRQATNQRAVDADLAEAREHAPALRSAIQALPDESRTYLVTIRIRSHPDFIGHRIPSGFDVVSIEEESSAA